MSDNFYRAFEDRYRGSRALIKSRLEVYKPFIEPLKNAMSKALAIDLGCGRGEWLELCRDIGLDAVGVDLDQGMLEACKELRLNVEHKDAIEYLESLADESAAVVSSFHVVEHIAFSKLQILIRESLRVLRPGGLLILETPNPENIVVAGSSFYLDPTHVRPIPPQLLSFLPEHYGFERVKVLRLQEATELVKTNSLTLLDVLNGVSPDYAVVARKDGPKHLLTSTEPAFNFSYGISLDSLAMTYEKQQQAKIEIFTSSTTQAEAREAKANALSQQLLVVVQNTHDQLAATETRVIQAEKQQALALKQAEQTLLSLQQAQGIAEQAEFRAQELTLLLQNAENELAQSNGRARDLESDLVSTKHYLSASEQANHFNWQRSNDLSNQVASIFDSRSWRVTAPLRAISTQLQSLSSLELHRRARVFLQHAALYIGRRPWLKNKVNRALSHFPHIKSKLFRMAAVGPIASSRNVVEPNHETSLSKHANNIFYDLKQAIEFNKKVKT